MTHTSSRAKRLSTLALTAFLTLVTGAAYSQMNSAMNPLQRMGQPSASETASRDFIRSAYRADQFEIQLSRLALHQGSSPDIKSFAQKTLSQQIALDQNIYSAKQQLGVHTPKHLSRRDTKQLNRIRKLSGAAFDQAYLQTLLRAFRKDKKSYSYQLQTTTNPTLPPILQQGLDFYNNRLAALNKPALAHNVSGKKSMR
jgi:putative membrane protein